jgi:hypothetical protein
MDASQTKKGDQAMRKNVKVKNTRPLLTLNKETLRNLELPENAVLGGMPPESEKPTCPLYSCNTC